MDVDEIKAIAGKKQVKVGKVTKKELVRAIQLAEGNSPCFATKTSKICSQNNCLWREYCT